MSSVANGRPFRYEAEVAPGEKKQFKYQIGETFLGDAVELPVTIINGVNDGPRVFLSAAIHGDEVNGVKVLQEVAQRYDPRDLSGTLVILHVVNVSGYNAHKRYLPIYDRDLNRSFPGKASGNEAQRMAKVIWDHFISQCDYGLDFHTSTRNKVTIYHVRADTSDEKVRALALAFGAPLILSGEGSSGMLRRVASEHDIPTITIEMGEAHRYQPILVDRAVEAVRNVLAHYGVVEGPSRPEPEWYRLVESKDEKTWIRAPAGGWVDMNFGPTPIVEKGDAICTISDHFNKEAHVVEAPFTGVLAGIAANPIAVPGQPLVHFVAIDEADREVIERMTSRTGYAALGIFHWMGQGGLQDWYREQVTATQRETESSGAGDADTDAGAAEIDIEVVDSRTERGPSE